MKLRKVEGNTLDVVGVDCLDSTPLLDIKPYFASTDSIPDAVTGAWNFPRFNQSLVQHKSAGPGPTVGGRLNPESRTGPSFCRLVPRKN